MPKRSHYSPVLSRFNVCVLYHEAKHKGVPMTQLADELLSKALIDSEGWKQAQAQLQKSPPKYITK
jgi:hypothetical protein